MKQFIVTITEEQWKDILQSVHARGICPQEEEKVLMAGIRYKITSVNVYTETHRLHDKTRSTIKRIDKRIK